VYWPDVVEALVVILTNSWSRQELHRLQSREHNAVTRQASQHVTQYQSWQQLGKKTPSKTFKRT